MDETIRFLLTYGYAVPFLCVLAEQIGSPVPAVPILLGVGALAGSWRMSIVVAPGVAVVASLPPDLAWYELGRRRGVQVLGVLCRVSLEPDTCVRRARDVRLAVYGDSTLSLGRRSPH